jgi:transaldolase
MPAKIIAASFKNVHQVAALLEAGIEAVTVPPEVCEKMFLHPGTEQAVQQFRELWRKAYQKDSL